MSLDSCLDLPGPAVLDANQLALIEPMGPPPAVGDAETQQPKATSEDNPPLPAAATTVELQKPVVTTSVSSVAKPREG
eukprot:COSAG06_NODE_61223_length_268_cov_0.775148_1_plen_77_part_10